MNIYGEYNIHCNIFTMFNVYTLQIKNHNLITDKGYEFFIKKWYYEDDDYPIKLGYYHDNKFYDRYNINGTYYDDLGFDGMYDTHLTYVDRNTNKQYRFDGENFVGLNERLSKICIGECNYIDNDTSIASKTDDELYVPLEEYEIEDFVFNGTKVVMKCEMDNDDLDGTTEIGVKTNHGRLVSHDIHPPYNLPFDSNIVLEYVFKLQKE